jgi:hypothetical protein
MNDLARIKVMRTMLFLYTWGGQKDVIERAMQTDPEIPKFT